MCSKEFCADFHCEILPIETEKHGRMNPTKKTVSADFFLQIWVLLSVKIQQKGGFVLDIILILTTNFYSHFLHLQIGLMFFSEHKIKGDSCFWIGNHFRHGFDFDQTLSFNLNPFHYGFTFQWAGSEHCWPVQSALSLSHFKISSHSSLTTPSLFDFESLWSACLGSFDTNRLLLETCLSRDNDNWFRF